jgi:uncharacterized damage-inducible protein DinB
LPFIAVHQPIDFPKEEIVMPVAEQVAVNSIAESFLAEFEAQAPFTRRFLERLPEDKLTWKPHEKSMTAGQLALHIATTTAGIVQLVRENPRQARGEFVFAQPASRDEILKAFDASVATVRSELPKFDDSYMHETWRLNAGDHELFAVPRMSFIRDGMLSHWYQHRGQFSVYLRLLNVAVPSTWGPSADEMPAFMQEKAKVA